MLRITIDPNGPANLNFANFQRLELPGPIDGVDEEINGDLILKFEDEAEAVAYFELLENLSLDLKDKSSVENLAIGEIIIAIRNDEFVKSYSNNQ
jgi:hypothetical protein